MFSSFDITSLTETNLASDRSIDEMKLLQKVNEIKKIAKDPKDLQITLKPMEIKTYLAHVTWNDAE